MQPSKSVNDIQDKELLIRKRIEELEAEEENEDETFEIAHLETEDFADDES